MAGEKTWHPVYSVCKAITQHSFQEQGYAALCIPVENVYPSGKCVPQWKVRTPMESVYLHTTVDIATATPDQLECTAH